MTLGDLHPIFPMGNMLESQTTYKNTGIATIFWGDFLLVG